jgi:hypothetical protein
MADDDVTAADVLVALAEGACPRRSAAALLLLVLASDDVGADAFDLALDAPQDA